MKRIVSQTLITTGLHRPRPFLRTSLRRVGFASLSLFLLSIFSIGSPSVSASHSSTVVNSSMQQAMATSSHADIVLVVDNINEIKAHDPTGARFLAAQMLVAQAQPGNRIGVVSIPSSDKFSPMKLLDLTTIQNGNDRNTVKHVLTQSFFGSIDSASTAYFVPAFQTASQMLLGVQDNNHKYIIVMTDALARSGDQEFCPSASDPYHQWFCEIPKLESQNISIIFFSFTIPGREAEIQPTQQYLQQHGGIVLQVG